MKSEWNLCKMNETDEKWMKFMENEWKLNEIYWSLENNFNKLSEYLVKTVWNWIRYKSNFKWNKDIIKI